MSENYYSISKLRTLINIELLKNNEQQYQKYSGLNQHQIGRDEEVKLLFSHDDVFISQKDLVFKLMDLKDKLIDNNATTQIESLKIDKALLNRKYYKKDLLEYEGFCNGIELEKLEKLAKKALEGNPNYFYFKNLGEVYHDLENTVSFDFEFYDNAFITELGISYWSPTEKSIISEHYIIDEHKDRVKNQSEPLHAKETKTINTTELKEKLSTLFQQYDSFVVHNYSAELKMIKRLFKGLNNTPFDDKNDKKIIDTYRASLYMSQREPDYFEGYDYSLKGICMATGQKFKEKDLHNAANDSYYTLLVAKKMAEDFRYKWNYYYKRDNQVKNVLPKTTSLNDLKRKKAP